MMYIPITELFPTTIGYGEIEISLKVIRASSSAQEVQSPGRDE
jgi:hypothetical protein